MTTFPGDRFEDLGDRTVRARRNFWTGEILPTCASISRIASAMSIPRTLSREIIRMLMHHCPFREKQKNSRNDPLFTASSGTCRAVRAAAGPGTRLPAPVR